MSSPAKAGGTKSSTAGSPCISRLRIYEAPAGVEAIRYGTPAGAKLRRGTPGIIFGPLVTRLVRTYSDSGATGCETQKADIFRKSGTFEFSASPIVRLRNRRCRFESSWVYPEPQRRTSSGVFCWLGTVPINASWLESRLSCLFGRAETSLDLGTQ